MVCRGGFIHSIESLAIASSGGNLACGGSISTAEDMSRRQEEHYLGLFWETYHVITPLLDEREFMQHYDSLWTEYLQPIRIVRRPSALVDSMMALCIQYGTALIADHPTTTKLDVSSKKIAGYDSYCRSRSLLAGEVERPSVYTLQCLIQLTLYSINLSLLKVAHQTLAVAVKTAHALKSHHEVANAPSFPGSSVLRRIWRTLFLLDSRINMELGQPYLMEISDALCDLPDDRSPADGSRPDGTTSLARFGTISLSEFHMQSVKLVKIVRSTRTAYNQEYHEIELTHGISDIYDRPDLLEACATHLLEAMRKVQDWVRSIPKALKSERKGGGAALSTARSAIEVDAFIPPWLQRQRILFELLYHNLMIVLYRPFIRFGPESSTALPICASHSLSCLNHAIVTTSIVHQVLNEVDILNCWQELYHHQWDAIIAIIGFSLAYPICPRTPSARRALHKAIANLDILAASNCPNAAIAANTARMLEYQIDLSVGDIRGGGRSISEQPPTISRSQPAFRNSDLPMFNVVPHYTSQTSRLSLSDITRHFAASVSQSSYEYQKSTTPSAASVDNSTTNLTDPAGLTNSFSSLCPTHAQPSPLAAPANLQNETLHNIPMYHSITTGFMPNNEHLQSGTAFSHLWSSGYWYNQQDAA